MISVRTKRELLILLPIVLFTSLHFISARYTDRDLTIPRVWEAIMVAQILRVLVTWFQHRKRADELSACE